MNIVVAGSQLPPLFLFILVLTLGLVLGSFVSVLVSRIPIKTSIMGRSKCPNCGVQLKNRDNIPIVGYLLLRGKCRNCRTSISPSYLILELVTAGAVFLPFLAFHRILLIIAWEIFIVIGISLSAIDLEHRRLPDRLTVSLFLFGLILLSADAIHSHRIHELKIALLSALSLGAFYWVVNFLSKGGMGMGDVKLAVPIGLFSGYQSGISVYVASMIGFALGSLIGLFMMAVGKASRKSTLPFGPFMIAGAMLTIWVTPWATNFRN
jgi:leader peptidase (prepilin peptidase)/N-methyltransferase